MQSVTDIIIVGWFFICGAFQITGITWNMIVSNLKCQVQIRDVPIPHFKLMLILLPTPAFRADTDTADTTDIFYLLSTSTKSFCKQYPRMYLVNLAFYRILNFF